jgi:Family of unknown function (DUF5343)
VSDVEFVPPYMAFGTFRNFLTGLNPERIPARIDRSLMIGMAGGTQTYLLQTLRLFQLIDGEGRASRQLVSLARDEDSFQREMGDIVHRFYADQLDLSAQQGTAAQLAESFSPSGYQGSTLRKAITFFLHACAAADIELSPHFRSPQPGRATNGSPRRKARLKAAPVLIAEDMQPSSTAAEQRTVQLRSGGTLTISCSTTFMELSRDDRSFVFGLVDQLDDYQDSSPREELSRPVEGESAK